MKLGTAVGVGVAAVALVVTPVEADAITSTKSYVHGGRVQLCVQWDQSENVGAACWDVAPGSLIDISVDDAVTASESVGLRYQFGGLHRETITFGAFCGQATLVVPPDAHWLSVSTLDPVTEQTYDAAARGNCGGVPTRGTITAVGVAPPGRVPPPPKTSGGR